MINNNEEQFSVKTETSVLKALARILDENRDAENRPTPEELKDKWVLDGANVCAIEGKTPEARRLLIRFADKNHLSDVATLNYYSDGKRENVARFNVDYLTKILKLMDSTFETVDIKVNKDYPITIDGTHFKAILAPRVE
jgi:hypothetical protein